MSKPPMLPGFTPREPIVVNWPPFGDGIPATPPMRTRTFRFVSMPNRVVDEAPATLLV